MQTKEILDELGVNHVSNEDCRNVRKICKAVSERAAYLASAGLLTITVFILFFHKYSYGAIFWHLLQIAHTHPFNGPFSGTTRVSRYQKGKTNLDFIEARDSEWQWHQVGHMQVCT